MKAELVSQLTDDNAADGKIGSGGWCGNHCKRCTKKYKMEKRDDRYAKI